MRAGNEREFVSGGSDGLLNVFSLSDISDPDECLVATINTGEGGEELFWRQSEYLRHL
jgi:hypothetical protein